MTELRVRPEAELDIFEAALWYERERDGLGAAFLQRVRSVFAASRTRRLSFRWSLRTSGGRYSFGSPSAFSFSWMETPNRALQQSITLPRFARAGARR